MTNPMLLQSQDDTVAAEMTGDNGAVCDNIADDEGNIRINDVAESEDPSSDLQIFQQDGSDAQDLHLRPNTLEKRKAGPDSIGETQSRKEIKHTNTGSQDTGSQDSTGTTMTTHTTMEKPQESLSPAQKNYIAKKLTSSLGRKYAASFVSLAQPNADDDGSSSMGLNRMLAKLLEDEYSSAAAFQDDVQLVVGNSTDGKRVLDYVSKFVEKLPKSLAYHRSKTEESAKGVSIVDTTRKLLSG
jgi:hypothetical protein